MKTFNGRIIASALLVTVLSTAAFAASHSGHERQSREAKLATVPGLTQVQRDNIIRIEKENHEARRALREKMRSDREALRAESSQKLRTALGDKAYADYATWKLEQRAEHRRDRGDRRGHRKGHRARSHGADQDMESETEE